MAVPDQSSKVRFGDWEADLRSGELRKHGTKIKLHNQPFQVLAILIQRAGEVVTREELRQQLWPANTFIDFDVGLNSAVKRLRDALGDSAENPRYVETIPRRGYRFVATIEKAPFSTPQDLKIQRGFAREGSSEVSAQRPQARVNIWLTASIAAAILAVLSGLTIRSLRQRFLATSEGNGIQSIAVLPLANLSGDAGQEYLADGMTEALITDLGKIASLRVISRTSVMHYKGTHKTLPEIARELGVDAVVEGSVMLMGDRVRVTARLVSAAEDRYLWAGTYENDLGNSLTLQDEIARSIANQVQVKVSYRIWRPAKRPIDPEAYENYLKGRYEWSKWTESALNNSIEYFHKSIQKDPDYAPAWVGLSDAYSMLSLFGFLPRETGMDQSKQAAEKALSLDNSSSEAHVLLGNAKVYGWLWPESEREMQLAIALDPNNSLAHQGYGYVLRAETRFDQAIAEMERARELDPLTLNKQQSLAATLYAAGHYDEALQEFLGIPDLPDPDANVARRHRLIAEIYERKGMEKEAVNEFVTSLKLSRRDDIAAKIQERYLASGYAEAKKAFFLEEISQIQRRANKGYLGTPSYEIAADYAVLGQNDQAFNWLDKAYDGHDAGIMYLKGDDRFFFLRSDPRLQNLLTRLGLTVAGATQNGAFGFSPRANTN